ncbi:MAG: NAD(P)H-dependent oxidoreductase [bacterium]|nr:NAD(P)H-dependent oxidoreductase [bacterium]
MFIPIILGTAREGRRSEKVARFLLGEVEKAGLTTQLVDPRDFRLPATDDTKTSEAARRYAAIITPADGYIIVTPEYNHGYPGELKMLLDMLFEEYARKPVGFCGVSSGQYGGARAIELLKLTAIEYGMVPLSTSLYFPQVKTLFDQDGTLINPAAYTERLHKFFKELLWYATALKCAREETAA